MISMKHYDAFSNVEEDVRQINQLVDVENKSVLEVGCGTGRITFPLAEKASEIVAIDIDESAIEEALKRKRYENVKFLVENIATTKLSKKFDVILSTWLGYMYISNVPEAVKNISNHLKDNGVFLLLSSYPKNEFNRIMNMLTGKTVKKTSFYNELEKLLSKYFAYEKRILKSQLVFSSKKDVMQKFQLELKNEHDMIMNNHHKQRLEDYLKNKKLTIGNDSLTYLCKKKREI